MCSSARAATPRLEIWPWGSPSRPTAPGVHRCSDRPRLYRGPAWRQGALVMRSARCMDAASFEWRHWQGGTRISRIRFHRTPRYSFRAWVGESVADPTDQRTDSSRLSPKWRACGRYHIDRERRWRQSCGGGQRSNGTKVVLLVGIRPPLPHYLLKPPAARSRDSCVFPQVGLESNLLLVC